MAIQTDQIKQITPDQIEQFKRLVILKREHQAQLEQLLVSKLNRIYIEAMVHKEQIAQEWKSFTDFTRGAHWPTRRPKYKVSAVLNFIIENIERKTALLTDAKPIPKVVPYRDQLQDTADILNELIRLIFQNSEFEQSKADMLQNAQVFGSAFMGTVYDRSSKEIRVISYDPRAVYVDPLLLKSYLLAEAEFFILEDIWAIEKARDLFPKVADRIRPDAMLSVYQPYHQDPSLFRAMISNIFKQREDNMAKSEIPRVHVREFWIKDRSREANGKLRFTNACRKIIQIGEVIADDGSNPYTDGLFPSDMFTWHSDFHSCWGWGDVELLKNPQELQNKIVALVVENLMLSSNAIWIGDTDALSKEDWIKLNNAPGSYVKKKPGRELRREPGLPFPEYVLKVMQFLGAAKDEMTGMVDVMRGVRTGQVSSGVGIESLQLMAQALIRLRSRSVEAMDARIGRKLISRIFQYYEPEKIVELLKLNRDSATIQAYSSELLKPINQRNMQWTNDLMFRIEPGSSLGLAKTQRRIEAFKLHQAQAIDDEALLNDLEYPNREKVLKRTEQKRQDSENLEVAARTNPQAGGKTQRFPNQAGGSPKGRV